MKALIDFLKDLVSVKVYLRLMGVLTALAGLGLAVSPDQVAPFALELPIEAIATADSGDPAGRVDYQPLFQHWGILLALVGVFMVVAASNRELEVSAMAISGVEKLFIAILGGLVFSDAFVTDAVLIIDTAGAIYSLGYFGVKLIGPSST